MPLEQSGLRRPSRPECDCYSCMDSYRARVARWCDANDIDPDDFYDDEQYDEDTGDRAVMWHGYKPQPVFRGNGPVYLGMELEIEAPQSQHSLESWARKVRKGLGEVVYLQEDGSINYGFEITTHPMSYPWAMREFAWDYLASMADEGFRTHPEVGIHVHVSRAGFTSECHLYRWLKFIYRNEPQVTKLARRRSSGWARFDRTYRNGAKRYAKKGYPAGLHGYLDDRYQAVNPNNRDTLEVRVFASSLKPREVKAALGFVDGAVEYTRQLDANKIIQANGWGWSNFVDWLRRQRDEYRPLLAELEALSCVS